MNPAEVSAQLAGLSRELDAVTRRLAEADMDAVTKRHAFDVAYAKAWLSNEGNAEMRKQLAVLQTAQQRLDSDVAGALVKALQSNIREIGTRIDVGRTLAASVRAEWNAGG